MVTTYSVMKFTQNRYIHTKTNQKEYKVLDKHILKKRNKNVIE